MSGIEQGPKCQWQSGNGDGHDLLQERIPQVVQAHVCRYHSEIKDTLPAYRPVVRAYCIMVEKY